MKEQEKLPVINAEAFDQSPGRYELREGTRSDAPSCPYGNRYEWIGYDKVDGKYVRVTKSVFKRLIRKIAPDNNNAE